MKNSKAISGPLSEGFCVLARRMNRWLIPGSMYELNGDQLYSTALVISPSDEIVRKYRKMFPWLPYADGITPGNEFLRVRHP